MMFRKDYSADQKRAWDWAVNTKEHLSQMSPSEIADEMENIFLGDYSDDMDVDQLLEYLDHLDKVAPIDEPFDAEESYQQFTHDHAALMDAAQTTGSAKPVRRFSKSVRRIILVAATIILLVGIASVAYASRTTFAQWVDETFSFGSRPAGEYTSLQEALDDYGVKENLLPRWLPKEYAVFEISVNKTPAFTVFFAQYKSVVNPECNLTITIREKPPGTPDAIHEKDNESVGTIESGADTYYITQNLDRTSIIWEIGRYECSLSGLIAEEDIPKIIDSIE